MCEKCNKCVHADCLGYDGQQDAEGVVSVITQRTSGRVCNLQVQAIDAHGGDPFSYYTVYTYSDRYTCTRVRTRVQL